MTYQRLATGEIMPSLSWEILVKVGDEQMIIELDDALRLSKFRKIMTLIAKSGKVIKVAINGKYYDISKITDKKEMTILEVGGVDESE